MVSSNFAGWNRLDNRADARAVNMSIKTTTKRICHLGRQSKWQLVFELYEEMHQKALEPDVITCSAVISACEKAKQLEQALELLEVMR